MWRSLRTFRMRFESPPISALSAASNNHLHHVMPRYHAEATSQDNQQPLRSTHPVECSLSSIGLARMYFSLREREAQYNCEHISYQQAYWQHEVRWRPSSDVGLLRVFLHDFSVFIHERAECLGLLRFPEINTPASQWITVTNPNPNWLTHVWLESNIHANNPVNKRFIGFFGSTWEIVLQFCIGIDNGPLLGRMTHRVCCDFPLLVKSLKLLFIRFKN